MTGCKVSQGKAGKSPAKLVMGIVWVEIRRSRVVDCAKDDAQAVEEEESERERVLVSVSRQTKHQSCGVVSWVWQRRWTAMFTAPLTRWKHQDPCNEHQSYVAIHEALVMLEREVCEHRWRGVRCAARHGRRRHWKETC